MSVRRVINAVAAAPHRAAFQHADLINRAGMIEQPNCFRIDARQHLDLELRLVLLGVLVPYRTLLETLRTPLTAVPVALCRFQPIKRQQLRNFLDVDRNFALCITAFWLTRLPQRVTSVEVREVPCVDGSEPKSAD